MKIDPQIESAQQRQRALEAWLNEHFSAYDQQIDTLPGDASFRRYHRLTLTPKTASLTRRSDETAANTSSEEEILHYIIMDAPPEVESIVEFVAVDELLSASINVPSIIAQDINQGFLVLQDFGTTEFAHLVADAPIDTVDCHYKHAIDTLIDLQSIPLTEAKTKAALPNYDKAMLTREMDLFSEWFIPYIGVEFTQESQQLWQIFKEAITNQVLSQPEVIVHRDYHSRNLMKDRLDAKRLGVIDFQDAVIGAYSYDLVSLLRDAYVQWDEDLIAHWLEYYRQQSLKSKNILVDFEDITVDEIKRDMNIMGVQRHLKILGIFIRLSERDGKSKYLADIPKVIQDLVIELEWLARYSASPLQDNVEAFKGWLESEVLPAYQSHFTRSIKPSSRSLIS